MNKNLLIKLIILILFILGIQACKSHRDIVTIPDELLRSADRALRTLHANQPDFDSYSARFSGRALWDGKEYPVAGSLKIQKDQVISLSVASFLGIEVLRMLITPDSIKFINRLQSTYFIGDISFISNLIGTELDFYMFQAILMGNDLNHFTADNFRVTDDRSLILLSSPARKPKNNRHGNPLRHSIWMDPTNFRIRKALFLDSSEERRIQADYNNFENLGGKLFPNDLILSFIEPGSRAELSIRMNRATLNEPQDFSFSIPSRYKLMDL